MAVFKCKMCGGELNINENTNVCECEFCGTKQTIPSADDEKKTNLFNRANALRMGNEFDRAISVYESIVNEFPNEAEAYWGMLLCEYGIEGLSYNMVDGKPVLTDEVQEHLNAGDTDWLINNIGAGFGGKGVVFFDFVLTDLDSKARFGEAHPGASGATTFENAVAIGKEYPITYRLVKGLNASAYMSAEAMESVRDGLSSLNYKEALLQAMFADSDAEAKQILEDFKKQMQGAGLADFEELLQRIYVADPDSVKFYR